MTRDPRRWLEDPSANPRLTELLRASADPLELPEAVNARVADALQHLARDAAGASAVAAGKPALVAVLGPKSLLIVGTLAVGAVVAGVSALRVASPRAASAERLVAAATLVEPTKAGPAREPPEPPVASVADLPLEPNRRAAIPSRSPTAPLPSSSSTLAEEARLLERLRAAIATDPAMARRTLAEYDDRFPTGVLREERSLLAVRLAVAEGRNSEAKARATELENTAKGSPYADKARKIVDSNERSGARRTITE